VTCQTIHIRAARTNDERHGATQRSPNISQFLTHLVGRDLLAAAPRSEKCDFRRHLLDRLAQLVRSLAGCKLLFQP
jgi:hypothetical protein